jgi:hypothetical protein
VFAWEYGWLLQIAPFGDPLYLNINGSHLAIRVETAKDWSWTNQNQALMINQNINIALIGNPNTGKTSVLINWLDSINKLEIILESLLKKNWFLQITQ